jgi:hypothetical protein
VNYAGCHAANWQGWRRSKALLHNTLVTGVRRLHMCAACDSLTSTSLELKQSPLIIPFFFLCQMLYFRGTIAYSALTQRF